MGTDWRDAWGKSDVYPSGLGEMCAREVPTDGVEGSGSIKDVCSLVYTTSRLCFIPALLHVQIVVPICNVIAAESGGS